jgi:hypothetical protein
LNGVALLRTPDASLRHLGVLVALFCAFCCGVFPSFLLPMVVVVVDAAGIPPPSADLPFPVSTWAVRPIADDSPSTGTSKHNCSNNMLELNTGGKCSWQALCNLYCRCTLKSGDVASPTGADTNTCARWSRAPSCFCIFSRVLQVLWVCVTT